jgi:hypothetical protein
MGLPKPMGRVDLSPKLPGEDWGGGVELYSLPVPNVGKNWQKKQINLSRAPLLGFRYSGSRPSE